MRNPFLALISTGILTETRLFPDLPDAATGLPAVGATPCTGCGRCAEACPMRAITLGADAQGPTVALDRGRCLGCQECIQACPTGTLTPDRATRVATCARAALIMTNRPACPPVTPPTARPFCRSLHIREVSTGDSAADLEVLASTNAVFDIARFGVHVVASPRFADALLVTGPVGRGMRDALLRCFEAMAEPRLVIAAGVSAISGGVHAGDYAEANGVADLLPIAAYIPGDPPHPWYLLHGILLAMGHPAVTGGR